MNPTPTPSNSKLDIGGGDKKVFGISGGSTTSKIREHYIRAKDIIQEHASIGNAWRAGIGDHWDWYAKEEEGKRLWDLTNDSDYKKLTQSHRTLYWSLNFFDDSVRGRRKEGDKPLGTLWDTVYYSLGIDIDTASGRDINEPEVTSAVQDCAQYFVDIFQDRGFQSYDVAFSGGGIYVIIHPMIAHLPLSTEINSEYLWKRGLKYFDVWIQKKAEEFYQKYEPLKPHIRDLVKVDSLNSAKRQWKTLLSIHKSKPYAVVPLDKENPRISFEDATIPLSESVLVHASDWLSEYHEEDQRIFYEEILKRDVKEEEVLVKKEEITEKELEIEPEKIETRDFPPCIINILARDRLPKGGTRATTLVATFLGQAGWQEAEAYDIFKKLCKRFEVSETNRFECWFRKMQVPTCERLQEEGGGFPRVGMRDVPGICTPDEHCKKIIHPLGYSRLRKREEAKTSTEERPRREVPYFGDASRLILEVLTTDKQYKFAYLKNGKVVLADNVDLENGITITPRRLPTRQEKIYEIVKMPNEHVATAPLLEPAELFHRIKKHFQRHIDLPQNDLELCIYYTLFTWFYPKTRTLGFLRFKADTGTGKSRMLETVGNLCFLPITISGAGSFSGALRTNEWWHGTMIIDESDFKGEKEHNIIKFLNLGFERGKYFPLSDKQNPKHQEWFDPFSPKILAMREPFSDNATEGRLLSISPHETANPDIKILLDEAYEHEAQELRNLICRFVFEHWHEMDAQKMLDFKDMHLEPRLRQLSMPLTIIFQLWQDGISLFRDYLVRRQKEMKRERSTSWEGSLFNFVYALAAGDEEIKEDYPDFYRSGELQAVTPKMVAKTFHTTSKNVTRSLQSIGFKIEKKHFFVDQKRGEEIVEKRKTVRAYTVPEERIWRQMVQRYFYTEGDEPEPEIPAILMSSRYVTGSNTKAYTLVESSEQQPPERPETHENSPNHHHHQPTAKYICPHCRTGFDTVHAAYEHECPKKEKGGEGEEKEDGDEV